jgi:hypothetical protein
MNILSKQDNVNSSQKIQMIKNFIQSNKEVERYD